jgi:DHA2 family multidrug resistance protein
LRAWPRYPLFGTIALLPLLTQLLMGYPAMTAGLLLFRGRCRAIALAVRGFLLRLIDPRYLVAVGHILSAIGAIVMARISRGLADSLARHDRRCRYGPVFVPLNAVAFGSIKDAKLDEASGLAALARHRLLSGDCGCELLLVHQSQVHWALMRISIRSIPQSPTSRVGTEHVVAKHHKKSWR